MEETDGADQLILRNRMLLAQAAATQAQAIEVRLMAEHLRERAAAAAARLPVAPGGIVLFNRKTTPYRKTTP